MEIPEPIDPADITDRFKQIVAVVIVTTTLIAGGVAYLETRADSLSDDAAARAEQFAIQSLTATTRSQGSALADYDTYIESETTKTKEAIAWRSYLQTNAGAAEESARVEQKVWEKVAQASRDANAIDLEGEQGPSADPVFPYRYLAEKSRDALVATALQDAANEESSAWGSMAVTFTAIVTMLAVALYLLGSSLAMRRRIGRILAASGAVVALIATVWAGLIAGNQPATAPPEAAEAFADGMVALDSAHDQASYSRAEELLSKAIELRPTFARAYVERSTATFQANSPQVPGVPSSISGTDAVLRSTGDLLKARELGYESASLSTSLGFHSVLLAVQGGRPEWLDDAKTFLDDAVARDPENPIHRYNLALALLAARRFEEADAAYDQALLATLFNDAAAAEREGRPPTQLRGNPELEQQWVTGALTDLQILVDGDDPAVADRATAIKQRVVGSAMRGTGELGVGDSDATISDVELLVFPAEVQHTATYDDPAERDPLWVQWYHRPSADVGWSAVLQVSGPVFEGSEEVSLRAFLPYSFPNSCLPVGEYRAEFYSDGKLIATENTTAPHQPFEAVVARSVNMGFCRPPDWQPSDVNINGLIEGYVSPDERSGAFILRLPAAPGEDTEADITAQLDDLQGYNELFLPAAVTTLDSGEFSEDYFLGFDAAETRDYYYDGGIMRAGAGAGTQDPGSIVIAMVFGPPESFAEDTSPTPQIFSSLLRLE